MTETHGSVEKQIDTKIEIKMFGTKVHSDKLKQSATRLSTTMGSHVEAKRSDEIITQTLIS